MVVKEGKSGHGEDRVAEGFRLGDLLNDMLDRFFDVFVSA
jgi:hypothetical protein